MAVLQQAEWDYCKINSDQVTVNSFTTQWVILHIELPELRSFVKVETELGRKNFNLNSKIQTEISTFNKNTDLTPVIDENENMDLTPTQMRTILLKVQVNLH